MVVGGSDAGVIYGNGGCSSCGDGGVRCLRFCLWRCCSVVQTAAVAFLAVRVADAVCSAVDVDVAVAATNCSRVCFGRLTDNQGVSSKRHAFFLIFLRPRLISHPEA